MGHGAWGMGMGSLLLHGSHSHVRSPAWNKFVAFRQLSYQIENSKLSLKETLGQGHSTTSQCQQVDFSGSGTSSLGFVELETTKSLFLTVSTSRHSS